MATRKFNSKKSALEFCEMINGTLIDVKKLKLQADCNFIVSYIGTSQLPKAERKLRRESFLIRDVMGAGYSNYLSEKQISGDFSDFN